MAAQTCWI